MSYNIQHGANMAGILNLDKIIEVIQDVNPDILGLQEVDQAFGDRSNFVDQVKTIADELDYHYCYGANLFVSDPKGAYGNAIISRHPIISSENVYLSSFGDEQRGILRAEIQVGEKKLSFYNTHLGLTLADRKTQVGEVSKQINKADGPTILVGDFNTTDDNEDYQVLLEKANLVDPFAEKPDLETFPANKPRERIDYILLSEGIQCEKAERIQVETSDHLPIIVEIKM